MPEKLLPNPMQNVHYEWPETTMPICWGYAPHPNQWILITTKLPKVTCPTCLEYIHG